MTRVRCLTYASLLRIALATLLAGVGQWRRAARLRRAQILSPSQAAESPPAAAAEAPQDDGFVCDDDIDTTPLTAAEEQALKDELWRQTLEYLKGVRDGARDVETVPGFAARGHSNQRREVQ